MQNLGRRFGTSKMHLSPQWLRLLSILRCGSVVADLSFIVTPIVGVCNCSMFCCTLLYVNSRFALICVSSWCLVIVVWLFLMMPRACLQFVIVVFLDHTHLLFLQSS